MSVYTITHTYRIESDGENTSTECLLFGCILVDPADVSGKQYYRITKYCIRPFQITHGTSCLSNPTDTSVYKSRDETVIV